MVSVVYPVIYFIIKTIFAKKCKVKRLEMQAYLLDYFYKIRVILAIRVQSNEAV